MQLITKESDIKSRIDEIERIEFLANSNILTIYFNVSKEIAGEKGDTVFDNKSPLTISIESVSEALQYIFQKALQLRAEQIEGVSTIKTLPDYKKFYTVLLSLDIFRLAQQLSATQLEINAAYSDVGFVLGNAIAGAENNGALQAAFDRLLLVLGSAVTDEHLQQLQDAIKANAIPLKLQDIK